MKIIKTINPFICLMAILFVSSCSNKLFLQRKYTKGHYFAHKSTIAQKANKSNKQLNDTKSNSKAIVFEKETTHEDLVTIEQFTEKKSDLTKNKSTHKVDEIKKSNFLTHVSETNKINHTHFLKIISKQTKKADLNAAVLSWTYSQLAISVLVIPFILFFLTASSPSVTAGVLLFTLFMIAIGTMLSIKSIRLGSDAFNGEGGFISKLIALYSLMNGAFAFIFALFLLALLISLL